MAIIMRRNDDDERGKEGGRSSALALAYLPCGTNIIPTVKPANRSYGARTEKGGDRHIHTCMMMMMSNCRMDKYIASS